MDPGPESAVALPRPGRPVHDRRGSVRKECRRRRPVRPALYPVFAEPRLLHAHDRYLQLRGIQRLVKSGQRSGQGFPADPCLRNDRFHLLDALDQLPQDRRQGDAGELHPAALFRHPLPGPVRLCVVDA